ncbi:tRNA (adenosine(37)-N6)-threonylcarbamoyltransferase complex ATPase subunit type 1 TsaE [Salinibacillus xinjiangensis]|uniref:tRNA threonylcarbamoyladenosine biosynthesis protein TsaE n=1 Tax=Salinibacillus xinjiangensis TaxID=1229268 RepID=A0A6G1X8L0_9BACI|nr:tRNA (adenosine(37)-N6)-threonylcarbamoyltransferase complex ATPase subunit type 1 TsaE [Salinibacillus xinjiangensis]MRG87341.1 tRNA (adenosine(37)-N6)-threonylcarbamoyltransferase complex ATPase subunit type 1 TsaE [Salinibacillus xinjiangensis]
MKSFKISTSSPEETMNFSANLANKLQPGDVITLEGDLGAGKTTFTKGLARGLNIKRTVNSPTFTIVKEYEGDLPLYHIDAYRLEHNEEDLGFDEYFEGDGIVVVEWAKFIADYLPEERLNIEITYQEQDGRIIELLPQGQRFEKMCRELTE